MNLVAALGAVSTTGVVATLGVTLPAQAAPDPGSGTCDKVYITHWQYDADTMRVRWNVKRCSPANAPRIRYVVDRNTKNLADGWFECPAEKLQCTRTRNYFDPGGGQNWIAFGRLYEAGSPNALVTYEEWRS